MKLSKRLERIVSMVPRLGPEGCVADVGTDHGFVPIRLVELGVCGRALAMDVRPGPLARARDHIRRHGLERQIDTRLGDGLEKLMPGEAQVVVIAGMGGELMLRILEEGSHVRRKISHWILSPQSELSQFRHGLEGLGLCIREEEMLQEDGKYYTIMDVVPGAMDYKREYQYRYGDRLIQKRSPVLAEYLEREMSQNRRIRAGLEGQTGEGAARRLGELVQEYQVMEEAWGAMGERSKRTVTQWAEAVGKPVTQVAEAVGKPVIQCREENRKPVKACRRGGRKS